MSMIITQVLEFKDQAQVCLDSTCGINEVSGADNGEEASMRPGNTMEVFSKSKLEKQPHAFISQLYLVNTYQLLLILFL